MLKMAEIHKSRKKKKSLAHFAFGWNFRIQFKCAIKRTDELHFTFSKFFLTHHWTNGSVYQQLSSSCWSQPDIMQQNWRCEKGHMTSNWDFFSLHFFYFFLTQYYLQLLVAFVSKHLDEGTKSAGFCFNALLWSYNITVGWSFRILISQINFTRKLNLHNFWVVFIVCLALGINKSVPWIYIIEKRNSKKHSKVNVLVSEGHCNKTAACVWVRAPCLRALQCWQTDLVWGDLWSVWGWNWAILLFKLWWWAWKQRLSDLPWVTWEVVYLGWIFSLKPSSTWAKHFLEHFSTGNTY